MSNTPKILVGFRFSVVDAVVLIAGAALAWWLYRSRMPLWWVVPMVVGHFFLFCNVFRVRRNYELLWAGLFAGNTVFWLLRLSTAWLPPLLVQAPVTLLVIFAEMLSPRYHGIFAARINRRLGEYIQSRTRPVLL